MLGTVVLGCFPAVEVIRHSHYLVWSSCFGKVLRELVLRLVTYKGGGKQQTYPPGSDVDAGVV